MTMARKAQIFRFLARIERYKGCRFRSRSQRRHRRHAGCAGQIGPPTQAEECCLQDPRRAKQAQEKRQGLGRRQTYNALLQGGAAWQAAVGKGKGWGEGANGAEPVIKAIEAEGHDKK